MSDQQFFRKYIDIINEEPNIYQRNNIANSQKWAKENPEAANYAKLAADVVTDYIPVISQAKSAYRAGKAAYDGNYGEAGKQLVGTFVPGGRRMVGAVDAGLDAAKGNYKGALSNLSYAAGGELGRAVSTGLAASDIAKAVVPNAPQSVPATQTAQSNTPSAEPDMSPTTGKYTPGPALQSLTKQASTTPKEPEPTTEEEDLDENSRMRKYLDIIDEGPPAGVGPNAAPKSQQPTLQQRANDLEAGTNQAAQGMTNLGQGNYTSGAMDVAKGMNTAANAAGLTTADKLKMGWTGLKAGANAGLAYLRGKGEEGALAAAAGTVGQEVTQPMAKYAKSKNFDKDFNQAMSAPNANDPSMQKMQQDAQRNLITSNSMKNYMTGVDKTMGDLKSGDATAFDRLGQQTMYRQDTMSPYLDISKKQALTGQQVQTPGELMGKEEPAAAQPTAPAAPAQQTAPAAAPQPTQPQQTTEEELEEELQKILRLSGRKKETTNETDSFKKFYRILNESSEKTELTESIELHDSFDIELNEHFVIETGIIGFTEDGIIIEADETLLGLLEVNNIIFEEETTQPKPDTKKKDKPSDDYIDTKPAANVKTDASKLIDKGPAEEKPLKGDPKDYIVKEAEYQGRKVPLGKPMAGDVAKSKVYVKKPNGKVVKVNFGDKNMKIKKSNPNRRKSFRARHRCENPGPRWKARYWSCRAW